MIVPNAHRRGRAGSSPTSRSLTRSRPSPLSRNRYSDSGEITYGGFDTPRSNLSPSTGSKKLPAGIDVLDRRSAPHSGLGERSAGLPFESVAITRRRGSTARIAWMPLPVPMSSADHRPADGEVSERDEGRWTPAT